MQFSQENVRACGNDPLAFNLIDKRLQLHNIVSSGCNFGDLFKRFLRVTHMPSSTDQPANLYHTLLDNEFAGIQFVSLGFHIS